MMNVETIQITPELLALLSEIDEFKGAWRAFGTLARTRGTIATSLAVKNDRMISP